MTICILCGREDATTLRMDVEFQDGAVALMDVELCAECRDYLEDHAKRLVPVLEVGALIEYGGEA